ncbi:hypothetical protein GP486_005432, partial [Trichoglossum hirsutum]
MGFSKFIVEYEGMSGVGSKLFSYILELVDTLDVLMKEHSSRTFRRKFQVFTDEQAMLDAGSLCLPISDEISAPPRRFMVAVDSTLKTLLDREDTDSNMQITIADNGPKVLSLGTARSGGFNQSDIRGTYMLSNLLQELTLEQDKEHKYITLDESRINEDPVHRLSRLIREMFWDNLTRRIDASAIEIAARDPKDWTDDPRPRIYVPLGAPEQYAYYTKVAQDRPNIRLDVQWLPEEISPEYVKSLNNKPGLLALEMEEHVKDRVTGAKELRGLPFVVPGGRFNELYGWDSYFCALGLLADGRPHLVRSIVQNFTFEIKHYGKILNANRSYYLCRSQPPFLTDLALRTYEAIQHEPGSVEFLRFSILAAIKEYNKVWMAEPRYDPESGLSRYRPPGLGVPPEPEDTQYAHILGPFASKYRLTLKEFVQAYNDGTVEEPDLDEYFLHDRAARESGHDISYRVENIAAHLATIDLNSLLYKYETDISRAIRTIFGDKLIVPAAFCVSGQEPDHVESSSLWDQRAERRKKLIDKYLWNQDKGLYFDYDTVTKKQGNFETVTCFWALWSGVASTDQAALLVSKGLPKFECAGGLVSTTKESRGELGPDRPEHQWDYPFGWAPHQILAWDGLIRYGFRKQAERLAYRWLHMMTRVFVDFNGTVAEKYNVTEVIDSHKVDAEYGNQGVDFKGVAREGFGWVNASYTHGLSIISPHMKCALDVCAPYEGFDRADEKSVGEREDIIVIKDPEADRRGSNTSLSGAAVLAQDLGDEQQGLLEAIDKLRFARLENIKLPQIVVVGDQSAGKSSVLEAITGVPFPRDAEACTRFATEIRLRRADEERFSIRIWPDTRDRIRTAQDVERLKRFGENVPSSASFDALMRQAVREIWPKNIPGRFASRDVLRVELAGPQMPLLTLVDLPGLVKNANKDQSGEDIQAINDIADEYMKSSRTIILAVVGGNNDFVHQTVLNRARRFDPDGSRTIGVLTKPDLTGTIGLEDKFIALVNNEDALNRFKLGWYVLLNPGPTETWLSPELRQQKEEEFFSRGKWSTLPRSMCGSGSLKKKLTEQLQHHISRHVPKLLQEIDQQLRTVESELEALGRGRDSVPEMREELAELCSTSEKLVTLAVKGSYDDPSFFPSGVDEKGTPPQKLRARVVDENERFAKKVRMLGHKGTLSENQAKKDYARKKVEPLLRQNRGTAFLGDSDPRLVYQLFQDYSSEWPKLAQDHRTKLGIICSEFLAELITYVWPRRMQQPLRAALVNEQIQERLKNADKEVERLRQDQHLYVQSYDPEYLERLEAWRTKVSTDGSKPSLAEEYLEKMLIHYELTAKTFTSNVITQVIERHLLQGFPEVFSALKVMRLDEAK